MNWPSGCDTVTFSYPFKSATVSTPSPVLSIFSKAIPIIFMRDWLIGGCMCVRKHVTESKGHSYTLACLTYPKCCQKFIKADCATTIFVKLYKHSLGILQLKRHSLGLWNYRAHTFSTSNVAYHAFIHKSYLFLS